MWFQSMLESLSGSMRSNPVVIAYTLLMLLYIPLTYQTELKTAMPYSKFANASSSSSSSGSSKEQKMVPSKIGMLIMYVPALLASLAYLSLTTFGLIPASFPPNLAVGMIVAHFTKRTLEVLFLHKYSGDADSTAARIVGVAYAVWATMISVTANPNPCTTSAVAGSVLFAIGLTGNFYHHYLLASLRSKSTQADGEKTYCAPKGGLFAYVAAPHYLFELMGWLGIAVVSEHITAFLTFLAMVSYLSARSINQNEWNKSKFGANAWPKTRKNLVPFLF